MMDLLVKIDLKKLPEPIMYQDKILLIGSCFTEHIGNSLQELKFSVLQNPNGILFDPLSVCRSLLSYAENRQYTTADLFQLDEMWHSWQHHSRYSHTDANEAVRVINESQQKAHAFLKEANWIIITLGSAFSYRLVPGPATSGVFNPDARGGVANCHRAPAQWFDKQLLEIDEIEYMLDNCYQRLLEINPKLNLLFTVSPVRHIRDGVVENNRSKARLIESVHYMTQKYNYDSAYYFPAYELVIDVLRDYRFYDIDLVHPNYSATSYVLEKFAETCLDEASQQLMEEVKRIVIARKHRPFQPDTKAHQQFLATHFQKAKTLQEKYPFLDLKKEIVYFSQT